jgi:hypothetical protein
VAAEPVQSNHALRDGGIVTDHQPYPYGGGGADTAFSDDFGFPTWQRLADDILLSEPATIRHITWWGFYGGSFDEYPEAPPSTEIIRIRFYQSRPSDGLPDEDDVLFEETFLDPSRTATGNVIWLGALPPEYVFEVDLPTPVILDAGTPYWLEITQIGNIDSLFRWEFSRADENGQAFTNPNTDGWRATTSITSDTAFQLSTIPEPMTLTLFLTGFSFAAARRRPRKESPLK